MGTSSGLNVILDQTLKRTPGCFIKEDLLAWMQASTRGQICEIGVFKGAAFQYLVSYGSVSGVTVHAFDSFEGMDAPGEYDGVQYPRGKLSVGGVERFKRHMQTYGFLESEYVCHAGFIPHCFRTYTVWAYGRIGFCIIDVDHYEPTKQAIEWVWDKMEIGGVLVFDDYYPGRGVLASRAIGEFVINKAMTEFTVLSMLNQQLAVKRVR